jgi:hypothetical protein
MDRNLTRVRALSYAAAAAIAAALFVALAVFRVDATLDDRGVAYILVSSEEQQQKIAKPPPRVALPNERPTIIVNDQGREADTSPRLWRYGAHGEIIFAYAEQFDRCTDARTHHKDQADCPNWRETHQYVLEQSPDAPLELSLHRPG